MSFRTRKTELKRKGRNYTSSSGFTSSKKRVGSCINIERQEGRGQLGSCLNLVPCRQTFVLAVVIGVRNYEG